MTEIGKKKIRKRPVKRGAQTPATSTRHSETFSVSLPSKYKKIIDGMKNGAIGKEAMHRYGGEKTQANHIFRLGIDELQKNGLIPEKDPLADARRFGLAGAILDFDEHDFHLELRSKGKVYVVVPSVARFLAKPSHRIAMLLRYKQSLPTRFIVHISKAEDGRYSPTIEDAAALKALFSPLSLPEIINLQRINMEAVDATRYRLSSPFRLIGIPNADKNFRAIKTENYAVVSHLPPTFVSSAIVYTKVDDGPHAERAINMNGMNVHYAGAADFYSQYGMHLYNVENSGATLELLPVVLADNQPALFESSREELARLKEGLAPRPVTPC